MKIRMLTSLAGVDFALSPGDVTERFGVEEATRLVQADYAVVIAGGDETVVQAPVGETRVGESEPGSSGATSAVDPPVGEVEPSASPGEATTDLMTGESEAPFSPAGETGDTDDKVALQAEAETLGIDVDKRWGVARLKAEIEAARAKAAG